MTMPEPRSHKQALDLDLLMNSGFPALSSASAAPPARPRSRNFKPFSVFSGNPVAPFLQSVSSMASSGLAYAASSCRRNFSPFSASASCDASNERQIAAARAMVFTLLVNDSITTGPS